MGGIAFKETFLFHLLLQRLTHLLVFVVEDGASETFDLTDDVPGLLIGDTLHDILQDPLQHHVGSAQVGNQLIHSQLLHLHIIETDLQVSGQVEFPCHVPQHTLEEGIDGLHTEIVVVMKQVRQSLSSPFPDEFRRIARLLHNHLQVVV